MTPALLDTDILSEILKLKHADVLKNALAYSQQYGALCFSAVTRYEVLRGYKKRTAVKQLAADTPTIVDEAQQIQQLLKQMVVKAAQIAPTQTASSMMLPGTGGGA